MCEKKTSCLSDEKMATAAETAKHQNHTQNILISSEKKAKNEEEKEKESNEKTRPPPLDMQAAQQNNSNGPQTPSNITPRTPGTSGSAAHKTDKERKLGHRRINEEGLTTYKKIESSQIMGSIQLGISHAVGSLASKPERDLLMHDFAIVETTLFPSDGSNLTPGHRYSEFKFKTYSPFAFRYFRDLFGIQTDDFLLSICSEPIRELTNPGASGSIFYLTNDDEFIIKTVQHKEGEFLQKLLPAYYMNLNQNPRTLLPKFFGLYCYQCGKKNVRLVVMNNLLPSSVKMHQKYDLKGSTFKRKANRSERKKQSPTYKDLDFMDLHPEGILLEADTYNALVRTIQRDCLVLESFKIMDYSLLVGIHNLDQAAKEKKEKREAELGILKEIPEEDMRTSVESENGQVNLSRSKSINRQRLAAFSTAMESIQAESDPIDEEEDTPAGGIPARNSKGERLLLFLGIIDILQSYRLKKKLEHTWKSMLHDGDTVSVHRPSFYAQRFQDFMAKTVFRKIPSPLKHSPSKRKGQVTRNRPMSITEVQENINSVKLSDADHTEISDSGMGRGIKDYRPMSFDPSNLSGGLSIDDVILDIKQRSNTDPTSNQSELIISSTERTSSHRITVTSHDLLGNIITFQGTDSASSSETNSSSTSGIGSTIRTITYTPPHSLGGSTPTHTEGTPSFTGSSSSGDLGCPTTPVKGFEHHPFHPQYQKTKPLSPLLGTDRVKHKPKLDEEKENYQETEMTHL